MGSIVMEAVWVSFWVVYFVIVGVHGANFDVKKFGAKADGKIDDSTAIMRAWGAACKAPGKNTMTIPAGKYLAGPVQFHGPCKGPVTIQAKGMVLLAPPDANKLKSQNGWIIFTSIDGLTFNGGTFDGQGAQSWKRNDCGKGGKICSSLPTNLVINALTNSAFHGITSRNSKFFHINIIDSKKVKLEHVTIDAPGKSPNTDGIHIGRSSGISIFGANIKTGDDCISIGDGCQQLHIEKVTCGPGHGLSIGSLGKYGNEKPVIGVTVKNCTLIKTDNGARIKTWPASPAGAASNMHFEDIIMKNVANPILIDQRYCPWNQCKAGVPSKIKLSDIRFRNIRGTSTSKVAVKLVCSKAIPCQKVEMSNVNLVYSGKDGPAVSQCANVKPTLTGKNLPKPCTARPPP